MSPNKFTQLKTLLSTFADNHGTRADSWGKDPKTMSIQEAEKELRAAARIKYGEMDGPNKKAFRERVDWIYKEHPGLKKINVFSDSSHVDLTKQRDELEKQIINTSSPQKQKELRLKLSKIEDQLHSRGDAVEKVWIVTIDGRTAEFQSVGEAKEVANAAKKRGSRVSVKEEKRSDAVTTDQKLATLGRMVHTLHKRMRMK